MINDDEVKLCFKNSESILVGGMDKEEDKVNLEIFYDKIKDKDKIDRLLKPNIFHNIKKLSYSKELSEDDKLDNPNNIQVDNDIESIEFETIEEDGIEKQKLKDNLLIKGNNLLGLHSLAKRVSGSIDVIYIDPPYYFNKSKASDSFAYNSNFKLSTWLTFMKNRLEIAKELLSDTGVIFISMNEDGNSHLKLLCDDVFGVENSISNLIIPRYSSQNMAKYFSTRNEFMVCYSKNKSTLDNKVGNFYEFKNGAKEVIKIIEKNKSEKNPEEVLKLVKEYYKSDKSLKGISMYTRIDDTYEIYRTTALDNPKNDEKRKYNILHPITNKNCVIPPRGWRYKEEDLKKKINNNEIYFGKDETTIPQNKTFLKNVLMETPKTIIDLKYKDGALELRELFNKDIFDFPKSSDLIKYMIFLSTYNNKNSTILDFFAGSGTTAHSVLSLNKEDNGNRKFILLEQMDYIESITSERIKRSMIKEGYEDSFVYMEMKESNTKELKNSIKSAKNKEELISLINDSFDNGYFININNKEQLILKIEEVYKSVAKKSKSIRTLNKAFYTSIGYLLENHMTHNEDYVSYENIEELKQIKENECKLNKTFYEDNNI